MKRVKVIELFAGYGSQHLALKRLKRHFPQFDYEVVAFCEIDKYAIKAYQALHDENMPNLGDITKVDAKSVPDCDLMTWSYPCTDISSAGKQAGLEEGSGTASSLCWDAIRIFEAKKPKYLLMENVPALLSKKFEGDFKTIRERLEGLGYTNYYQTLNAKNYGVPQKRKRVFMVSILDDHQPYHFPKPFPLERRLKDVLEQDVPDRYYLPDERVQRLLSLIPKEENEEPKVQCVGSLNPSDDWHGSIRQRHRVYSPNGCSPTLETAQGGQRVPKIVEQANTAALRTRSYAGKPQSLEMGGLDAANAIVKEQTIIEKVGDRSNPSISESDCAFTIAANPMSDRGQLVKEQLLLNGDSEGNASTITNPKGGHKEMGVLEHSSQIRIRKLTERELFRLQDVDDGDIDILLNAGISNTQLAKLAGNSIVVNVLYHIFRTMFVETEQEVASNEQLKLF